MRLRSHLFLGMKGHVVCVRRIDGEQVWRTKLTGFSITTLFVGEDRIYAATNGRLFGLNALTGEIIWENPLKGLGLGVGFLGRDPQPAIVAAVLAAQAGAQASTAAASGAAVVAITNR